MLETILNWDAALFTFIHVELANPIFDAILPWIRNKYVWFPFYVFFMVWVIYRHKTKGIALVIFTAFAVVLADQISASMIKPYFERIRPYNEPNFSEFIRTLIPAHRGFSFVSSHATNHFAIAVLFAEGFGMSFSRKRMRWIFYSWAALICFAQVYVAAHYPADIICGAILGLIIGFGLRSLWLRISLPVSPVHSGI